MAPGQQRLEQWKAHPPFDSASFLDQWLAVTGIGEREFLFLLGEPEESLASRLPAIPPWVRTMEEGFSTPAGPAPESIRGGFVEIFWPLIARGMARLESAAAFLAGSSSEVSFDPRTVAGLLLPGVAARLKFVVDRTLVLELHVARLRKLLSGETPEERFQSFLGNLRDRGALVRLLREYPVLARQVSLVVEQWTSSSMELLEHLCRDAPLLVKHFKVEGRLGRLNEIKMNAGDRHRQGRSVGILGFDSGLKLVYKPKPLAVDLHFQQLLRWINRRLGAEEFSTFEVMDCHTHGWVEFVPFRPCASPAEVRRFYERQGGYLALLYALEANDFHSENIIARGEHPVLIDLECLFQPRLQSASRAFAGLTDSAMRVGMLPNRSWLDDGAEGFDVSGLGGAPGQLTPAGVPYWRGEGTDAMHLDRQRMRTPGNRNRPSLGNDPVDIFDYAESLTEGFARIYRFLISVRDELLSDSGPLAAFGGDEIRILFRPTRTYVRLLYESFHPDVLRDALDRDCLFLRLWSGVEQQPHLAGILPVELRALHNQDVPVFTARVSGRDLGNGEEEEIPGFLEKSGMECVRDRLSRLDENDLARQLWFVRSSLATLTVATDQARWPTYTLSDPVESFSPQQILAAARAVGDRLESLALLDGDEAIWVGLAFVNEGHWVLRPLGPEFYGGLSGIAFFLAWLGEMAREPRYTQLARATLATVHKQLREPNDPFKSVGGYTGWGGIIYCFTQLGVLWKETHWLREAERILSLLPPLVEQDIYFDVMSGSAGCIAALLGLHSCAPGCGALQLALQCGEKLLNAAVPAGNGIAWPSSVAKAHPLGGFSHGASGCLWALLQLFALTRDDRYRAAALRALDYERGLYSAEAENWRDLRGLNRANPDPNQFRVAWCHGASGIGLGRLRSLKYLDSTAEEELEIALKTTLRRGFGTNHSLCHGDLGNLDLLLEAAKTRTHGDRWKEEATRMTNVIVESIARHGWLCGVPLGVESPGLLTGLAGIGYGLLRAAYPDQLPSVLVLEPAVQQKEPAQP